MKRYDPRRPLASLHIPKTAGTSFREALGGWFGKRLKLHYPTDTAPPQRHELQPGACVHGHFNRVRGIGVGDYYPEIDQFIVFVREPFARAVSQWRYLQHQRRSGWLLPELAGVDTFEDWLAVRKDRYPEHLDPFTMNAQLPVSACADETCRFDLFVHVGLTEDYHLSLRRMARALGRPEPVASQWLNRAPSHDEVRFSRSDYEARFPAECALYEQAKRLARS